MSLDTAFRPLPSSSPGRPVLHARLDASASSVQIVADESGARATGLGSSTDCAWPLLGHTLARAVAAVGLMPLGGEGLPHCMQRLHRK